MPGLHGLDTSEWARRVGSLGQLVRADSYVFSDGPVRGTRCIHITDGAGLEADLHPDRALDIGRVTIDGIPVAWMSPVGIVGPDAREPDGHGYLRTFGGGMLATCGLDTFGGPSYDLGRVYGQHGRIGTTPATVQRVEAGVERVVVSGTVRQAAVFGETLLLEREISMAVGSRTLTIRDRVTNESTAEQGHMILYHMNFGWPLVSDDTTIQVTAAETQPRDKIAIAGMDTWGQVGAPVDEYQEQVFTHELVAGRQEAVLSNPVLGLDVTVSVDSAQLPFLHEWKMLSPKTYVVGLEPANCRELRGRAFARRAGELPTLAPGQSSDYEVVVSFRRPAEASPARA